MEYILSFHHITDEEAKAICDWHYEGNYSCYDLPPYEEMKTRKMSFFNPVKAQNFYCYYDGNLFVGFTNLVEEPHEVFLGIGVHPDHCSKGYGTAIIKEACFISKTLYPDKPIYLEVRTWNKRAIRCYEKAGFIIDGQPFEQKTYAGTAVFYRMIQK